MLTFEKATNSPISAGDSIAFMPKSNGGCTGAAAEVKEGLHGGTLDADLSVTLSFQRSGIYAVCYANTVTRRARVLQTATLTDANFVWLPHISLSVDPESPSPPAAPLELGAGMAQTTSGDDLSAGAIAGIVIGVLVLLSGFVFILFFSFYRRKRCKAILENGMQCRDRAEKDGLCADHWQCSARMENGRRCSRCSEEKCERSMVGTYMFCKHHSHIAIKVEAVAAASRCVVFGRGLSQAIVKEVAEFSICAFDKNGVKRLTGGDEFKVSVKQMTQPPAILRARINDQDDGTYVCEYLPVVVGQVEITITHGGQALPGSPHIIEVISNSPPKPRYTVVKKAETSNINKIARICAKDAIEAAIEELRIEEQNFQRKPPIPGNLHLAKAVSSLAEGDLKKAEHDSLLQAVGYYTDMEVGETRWARQLRRTKWERIDPNKNETLSLGLPTDRVLGQNLNISDPTGTIVRPARPAGIYATVTRNLAFGPRIEYIEEKGDDEIPVLGAVGVFSRATSHSTYHKEIGARLSVLGDGGDQSVDRPVSYRVGLGVTTGGGVKDDSVSLKALGTGIIFGRRIGVSFLDNEVNLDLFKAFKRPESAKPVAEATPISEMEARIGAIMAKSENSPQAFAGSSRWAAAGRKVMDPKYGMVSPTERLWRVTKPSSS